jgi:hypothetical protein
VCFPFLSRHQISESYLVVPSAFFSAIAWNGHYQVLKVSPALNVNRQVDFLSCCLAMRVQFDIITGRRSSKHLSASTARPWQRVLLAHRFSRWCADSRQTL